MAGSGSVSTETRTARTVRIPLPGGPELQVSLWHTEDGESDTLVLTKAWKDEPAVTTRQLNLQVDVPADAIPELIEALGELEVEA